ncbi:MAG: DUF2285 domain-containing protein [Aliidongia sp.]
MWRCLTGRSLGPNPAALSKARRDRSSSPYAPSTDGFQTGPIARLPLGFFGAGNVSERGWKSHDLRDRTMRLVRFGRGMMQGDYRHLLLHPYRRRS